MTARLVDLVGSKGASETGSPTPKAAAGRHAKAGDLAFAETLSDEMGKPGGARSPGPGRSRAPEKAAKKIPSAPAAGPQGSGRNPDVQPEDLPGADAESSANGSESSPGATAKGPDTSAGPSRARTRGLPKGESAREPTRSARPTRETSKLTRLAQGGAEPTVPPAALAATRAATPLVREPRSAERGQRSKAPERIETKGRSSQPEPSSPVPAMALAAPSPRAATPAAASRTSSAPATEARTELQGDVPAEGAVLRHAAHLRVESPNLGEIALHLRVRGGVAHVRFDGENASALRERAPELARDLAREGLSLARIDPPTPTSHAADNTPAGSGHTGAGTPGWDASGRGGERHQNDSEDAESSAGSPRRPEQRTTLRMSGRVHVQA